VKILRYSITSFSTTAGATSSGFAVSSSSQSFPPWGLSRQIASWPAFFLFLRPDSSLPCGERLRLSLPRSTKIGARDSTVYLSRRFAHLPDRLPVTRPPRCGETLRSAERFARLPEKVSPRTPFRSSGFFLDSSKIPLFVILPDATRLSCFLESSKGRAGLLRIS